jgi:gluconate:H+ symporter, GntP family
MNLSFLQVMFFLLAGIVAIILLTVKWKWHPFFALLAACFVTGIGVELPFATILELVKNGFGDVLSKLAVIIVLGTSIGVLLEKNGSTQVMAASILNLVGKKRSSLALSITGFIVGLPIFCDSGYIVLNGINQSLIRRTGIAAVTLSVSLASGLYAVHCLLPPHPGATAAAGKLGVDFGVLLGYGIVVAIPAMLVGHWWAVYGGKKSGQAPAVENSDQQQFAKQMLPAVWEAYLPVVLPILLMAGKSMIELEKREGLLSDLLEILGNPSVALALGLLVAVTTSLKQGIQLSPVIAGAVEKAGSILVIIGAGGAFGAVLAASRMGDHFSSSFNLQSMGIWFPFLITFIIKTAQGSSTVASITAASIVLPLLPLLGLDSENGRILAVLAIGAGSMMISHTNDAYFWVVSKFSDIGVKTMLRVHSIASILMGLVTMLVIYLLSLFIL